jgi:RNA polymerase sigma-54 factor
MALGLRLDVRQTQSLVLTPQLQQAIKLLQLSNIELRGVVDREVAENPFLVPADTAERRIPVPPDRTAVLAGEPGLRPDSGAEEPVPPPPPVSADHRLGLRRTSANAHDELTPAEDRLTKTPGLRELLAAQLREQDLATWVLDLALILVEDIDDDGYLRDSDEVLAERYRVERDQVAVARRALQACEPTGVGACDLAECLALQLAERDRLDPFMRRLVNHLPLLARADFAALTRLCGVDAEELQGMIAEIKALNPRPGAALFSEPTELAVPDVVVRPMGDGRWRVELNTETLPRVLVDSGYFAELSSRRLEPREREYLSERMQSATWLTKALDQRARTVLRVTKAIFARQLGFLEAGAQGLRPLILRDIATATGLHESTVSRATSDKYVATPWGTFPLKFFFTTAIAATSGVETHSAEAIRLQIKRMIERESPESVLSDDQIVAELERSGVAIARRTVAKYRESMGIASSIDRRRQRALGR